MDYLQEIAELREELRRHSIAYYDKDAPTISDFEYDAMMRRLENLEAPGDRYAGLADAARRRSPFGEILARAPRRSA